MTPDSEQLTLELTRVLSAPPPVVFRWFSDPDRLAKWWGPAGFSIPSADFEPRAGGGYRIEMQPPEGDPFFLTGRFREVDPPKCLGFTFVWEDPDPDDVETDVELSFLDLGGSTEVGLNQGLFKTEARRALPTFAGFSAERGERFFNARHGGDWSCATCHTSDARRPGRHAATGKDIAPLAPAANPERFTTASTVEKWFRRNCNDVLGRECTPGEKADVLAWLMTLK